jgi:hypothetical protein
VVGSGLLLALATSGGIVGERISGGDVWVALFVNALITLVSVVVLALTFERMGTTTVLAQAAGAACGIVLVHFIVRQHFLAEVPWLSERPAQLVNDVAATAAALTLIWACARGLDARVLGAALILLTVYRLTASRWHLDHSPHGFQATVQQLVVFQFAASAFGLLVFSHLRHLRQRRTRA